MTRVDVSTLSLILLGIGVAGFIGTAWCPPGHRHWDGATLTTALTHIAIQEALDGKVVTWMEHVSDDEYRAGPPKSHD